MAPPRSHGCAQRGKMPIRERIANVLDPDTPFLEISPLAGYGSSYTIGGGMVIGIGIIAGTECVIMGNDPIRPRRRAHALRPARSGCGRLEIARDNRIPYVSFVESAGADLRMGGDRATEGPHDARRRTSPRAAASSTR